MHGNETDQTNTGLHEELKERLLALTADKANLPEIRKILLDMPPADAADAIELFEPDLQLAIFLSLNKDEAADIFTYVDSDLRTHLIDNISEKGTSEKIKQEFYKLFEEIHVDDAADIIDELRDELPANVVDALINSAKSKERRNQINQILSYPDNSAGSIMTVEYIMVGDQISAEQALEHIRRQGRDKETIYNVYAVGKGRKLTGALSLRDIILAPPETRICDLMSTPVIHACTLDDQEQVALKFKEYDLLAMPVVDKEDRLVGIITIDDVVDVIEAENTEDFEKMAALHPSEDEYLKTNVFRLARNRIPWLVVMMVSATVTGWIISRFQSVLEKQVILATFIPMLMDTGGNCGAQISTLIIRGMAVGEIKLSDCLQVVWKELRVGMLVALVLCTLNCFRMYYLVPGITWVVAIVVNITLFITVTLAKIIGCLLPLAAKALKRDPALMATPMLTTIVDAITLAVYFLVARRILGL